MARLVINSTLTDINFCLQLPPYSAEFVQELVALNNLIFGDIDPNYVRWRLDNMPHTSTFYAESASELTAYKIGYAMTQTKYYSWLGGVHPDHRREGLASELMKRQHNWAAEQGYQLIETSANKENVAMARLNLSHGFTICGTRAEPDRIQVLYLKILAKSSNAR